MAVPSRSCRVRERRSDYRSLYRGSRRTEDGCSRVTTASTCTVFFFFFQAEDGIRDYKVTGVQTCALPIFDATTQFVTVYHLIVEGALFLTGMRYQLEGGRRWGRTWGFYQGFTAATRDESRHVLFGVRYLRDRVTENPQRYVPLIQDTIREFRPLIPT